MTKERIASILLENKAVTLSPSHPYIYTSGIKSPIYCDNRLMISYPKARSEIIEEFLAMIKNNNINCDIIAGTATAAIPWAAFLAQKLDKPMIYVRKQSKGYGKDKLIEGSVETGKVVLLIEDLISTGASSLVGVEAIRTAGAVCNQVLAIFTYELPVSTKAFSEKNTILYTLSNFSTLVDVAIKKKFISENEKEKVLSWNKNPESWK